METNKFFSYLRVPFAFSNGFTLIEILVTMAIIVFIATIGIIIGIDSYQRYLLHSDLDKVAVMLQAARSQSINNFDQSSHGVYFGNSGSFVLFEGDSYASRDASHDIVFDKSPLATVSGASEVVFAPLSGATTAATLSINDGTRHLDIDINSAGGIDW